MGCDGNLGFVRALCVRLQFHWSDSLNCPIPDALSSSPWRLPARLPSWLFSLDDPKLGSISVQMIETGRCNSLRDKKLATVFRWLRFALSRRPFGTAAFCPRDARWTWSLFVLSTSRRFVRSSNTARAAQPSYPIDGSLCVKQHLGRALPFRYGGAQASFAQRIRKEHPQRPYILILR
jgi:hypothetical protein